MTESLPSPTRLSLDSIDLDRHAVIESSAGTGKTYTIQEIIVKLLTENKVDSLDQILAVTFTEKATGELKDRVRKRIQQELGVTNHLTLRAAYDNFDTASIYTIHGFCNNILQEFAFEHGEQFQNELADDRAVFRRVLHQLLRDEWPSQYGKRFARFIESSGVADMIQNSGWFDRIIEVALRYQPQAGDRLVPEPAGTLDDIITAAKKAEEGCAEILNKLQKKVGIINPENIEESELCQRYKSLNLKQNVVPKRIRHLSHILQCITALEQESSPLAAFSTYIEPILQEQKGFEFLNNGWKKEGPDFDTKLPALPEIINLLEELRSIDLQGIRDGFSAIAVSQLIARASRDKRSRGIISYNDMVARVAAALGERRSDILSILRKRYRYALVDEFQDTDMLQWSIFKAIFLDGDGNRLFVIGDPKQAIYGFRGADINAYYTARKAMINTYKANFYSLDVNYRSSQSLISAFNRLFADTASPWFDKSDIACPENVFPEQPARSFHLDGESFVAVFCGECSGGEARRRNACFIADEIESLINVNPSLRDGKIAILVRKWNEAVIVEKALRRKNIRYSYYKKDGLYQSREALEILYILSAIAQPTDAAAFKKALATRFFRLPPPLLRFADTIDERHPAVRLMRAWQDMAEEGDWPRLFDSMLCDTGVLLSEDIACDRSIENTYRTILYRLEEDAVRRNRSINELLDSLGRLRAGYDYGEEGYNIHPLDTERPGVQLMTMHVSKGLQFDIVFIAGGFTADDRDSFWTYHLDDARIFDLQMEDSCKQCYEQERDGETERLFYVALTRAIERVYVPYFNPTKKTDPCILNSTIPAFLERMNNTNGAAFVDWERNKKARTSYPSFEEQRQIQPQFIPPQPLLPDTSLSFMDRVLRIQSFSGIKHASRKAAAAHGISHEYIWDSAVREQDEPTCRNLLKGAYTSLPPGKDTGHLLHTVLQYIDYQKVGRSIGPDDLLAPNADSRAIIYTALRRYFPHASSKEHDLLAGEAARLVWNALHTPIDGKGLCLCAVTHKAHEVEFYYPQELFQHQDIPDIGTHNGFLHGYIDLVFEYRGCCYLLDWKSNLLPEGYQREHLERNIRELRYDLQMAIYESALRNYLRMNAHLPSPNRFGGIYYLYLRGIKPSSSDGIYFTERSVNVHTT